MAFEPEQNNLLTRCAAFQRLNVNIERIDNWINDHFQATCSSLQNSQAGMFANTYLHMSKHPEHTRTLKTARLQVLNISIQTDRDEAPVVPLCLSGIQLAWSA